MFKDFLATPGLAPAWLLGTIGKLKLQMFGSTIDQLTGEVTGKSTFAAEAALALKADPTALPLIGNDRLLVQGPSEPTATFRQRLRTAIDDWRYFAGNDWGLMLQALSQFVGLNGATAPRIRVVHGGATPTWQWFEPGADTTQPPWFARGAWTWDGLAGQNGPDVSDAQAGTAWWRIWMIVESVGGAAFATQWPTLGTGGQPTLGNSTGSSLGFTNVTPQFWATLRQILDIRKQRGATLKYVVVAFSSTILGPGFAGNPDGTWGYGYKILNGQYVATWPANVLPVPGPVDPQAGAPNNVAHPEFGYRIVGGNYYAM